MAATGRVWRTRVWLAILAALALLAIFAAGQTAAYFIGRLSPAIVDGVCSTTAAPGAGDGGVSVRIRPVLVAYVLIVRALVKPEPKPRKAERVMPD